MNKRQLLSLGVPESCAAAAIACITRGAHEKAFLEAKPAEAIAAVVADPRAYLAHPLFGDLARQLQNWEQEEVAPAGEPAVFTEWGDDLDEQSRNQMRDACSLPVSVSGALMPDAHLGYGLPIGGVLATDQAVIPYAVGVDIACRMRLTITDLAVEDVSAAPERFDKGLLKGTRFGVGQEWKQRQTHNVMDQDWSVTRLTSDLKDLAWRQLGTSGSGNHFAEWGVLTLDQADLGLPAGRFVALMSHSGSRGTGARICQYYSSVAEQRLPKRYYDRKRLAWLSLDSEPGQEYWLAMNLMGDYAAANHAVLHRNVLEIAGAQSLAVIENHHNFAWKEVHDGREVIVHRKGATPAGKGILGVIPGSMADPAFVVRGKGETKSLRSASHGAGRRMSRTSARNQFTWKQWKPQLETRGVRLLGGGLDEVPGAYKDIRTVMAAQQDLVEVVAMFEPKIVLMCADGSRAED